MNTASILPKTLTKKTVNINKVISLANHFVVVGNGDYDTAIKYIKALVEIATDLSNQLSLSSQNSRIPSSLDKRNVIKTRFDVKVTQDAPVKKKQDGQLGHKGETLALVDNPDKIIDIPIDTSTLPLVIM